jgi:hypothetical protein
MISDRNPDLHKREQGNGNNMREKSFVLNRSERLLIV